MAVEARRGCGYRKIGGLYLVGDAFGVPCDRLPFPLHVCPVCSAGIKQARGWTWFDAAALFGGKHTDCTDAFPGCPVCAGTIERAGLIWIGEKFYKTPLEFDIEAAELGVSRRISAVPRDFKVGETWVLLAHPKACINVAAKEGEDAFLPGIFRVWRPSGIEKLLPESATPEESQALIERGIRPVFVPDNDPDHQSSKRFEAEVV